jgi:hypothetical protein
MRGGLHSRKGKVHKARMAAPPPLMYLVLSSAAPNLQINATPKHLSNEN